MTIIGFLLGQALTIKVNSMNNHSQIPLNWTERNGYAAVVILVSEKSLMPGAKEV